MTHDRGEEEMAAAEGEPSWSLDDLTRLLALFAWDDTDSLWWRGRERVMEPPIDFYVQCNDWFSWGCADCEPIAPDDLAALAQAKADMTDGDMPDYHWPLLWCCRKREQRPQGACYKHIPEQYRHLFDACGPERATGLGNPVATPSPASLDLP